MNIHGCRNFVQAIFGESFEGFTHLQMELIEKLLEVSFKGDKKLEILVIMHFGLQNGEQLDYKQLGQKFGITYQAVKARIEGFILYIQHSKIPELQEILRDCFKSRMRRPNTLFDCHKRIDELEREVSQLKSL